MTKSEAQTRSEIIDKQLDMAGWNIQDPTQVVEEFDILTKLPEGVTEPQTPYRGHQFSDYVLLGKDGKPLAVAEAKKTSKDAAIGREQAKQYCFNIQKQIGCELPFCFYTNGLETYLLNRDFETEVHRVNLLKLLEADKNSADNFDPLVTRLKRCASCSMDIDHLAPDDLDIEFGPEALNEEIETWKDIYGIEERYKAKCCGESDGKYWVAQILDEWHEDGRTPADYLATLTRQTSKYPFADSNFLKTAFLKGCRCKGLFNAEAEGV